MSDVQFTPDGVLVVDVSELAAEAQASIHSHVRVWNGMTWAERSEWSDLPTNQDKVDALDARIEAVS